jgi:hypothetical protein
VHRLTSSPGCCTIMVKLIIKKGEHYILTSNGGRIVIDEIVVNSGGMLTRNPTDKNIAIKKTLIAPGGIVISKS